MKVKVSIPTIMRTLTDNQKVVEVSGADINQVINNMGSQYPGLKERLVEDGNVHRYINIFLNEDDIRFTGSMNTQVKEGDHITILPAVAGG